MRLNSGLFYYAGKVIISGQVVELYRYQKGVFKGQGSNGGRRGDSGNSNKEKNRIDVLNRARRDIRRIVNANYNKWGNNVTSKFVTLTFRENVKDLKSANYEFKKFILRLNYNLFGKKCNELKYTVVPEFQKRGAVHYHVVFYNLPYVKNNVLADIWGNGFIKINKIDDVKNVGAYVCKYLSKDIAVDDRLKGNKCYFNSRGLKKPRELYIDEEKVVYLMEKIPDEYKVYENIFDSEYVGSVYYAQYNFCGVNEEFLGEIVDDL